MTERLYGSSVPVFRVDGTIKGELARDLLRLDVQETTAGLKTFSAELLAVGGTSTEGEINYLDGAVVDFGKELDVSMGLTGEERSVFKGLVSALEVAFEEGQAPRVFVFAEDKLMKLRMTRRMKTYENVTDADVASAIASEHGLTPSVSADGPTYDLVQQWNVSDLAFLRERARLVQAEVWIQDDTLHFESRQNRTASSVTLVQGNHLIAAQIRADLAHQRTKVKVSGYDAKERDTIDEEATGDAIQAEVSGGKTGPQVLAQALGERVSYRVREVPLADGEATAWAKNEMLRRARGFVTVVGTTRGTPDLVVGSRVTLERVGAPFEGEGYYVTKVCQSYDLSHGHRTHFEAERPTVNEGA